MWQRQPPIDPVVAVVGVQPPPLHGQSAMDARILALLRRRGVSTVKIDLAVRGARSRAEFLFRRLAKMLAGNYRLLRVVHGARQRVVYIGLSGGWGQAVDSTFLILGRLLGARVVVHHHSFAYLDRRSRLAALVFRAARPATHVALCEAMARRMQSLYGMDVQVLVAPNAAFLPAAGSAMERTALRTVAFLSNISRDKGVSAFLDVARRMRDGGLRFRIAGPFADAAAEAEVVTALQGLPQLSYAGPVYGQDKLRFLRESDALLFPSRYRNEADPLVIQEALAHGTPVIATDRGCTASVLDQSCGQVVPAEEDFASAAASLLKRWRSDAAEFQRVSRAARSRYVTLRDQYEQARERLLSLLCCNEIEMVEREASPAHAV